MPQSEKAEAIRREEWVTLYRRKNPAADRWAVGYGAIHHTAETQARVFAMAELLAARGVRGDGVPLFDVLLRGRPRRQRRHVAGGPRDLRPQRLPGRAQPLARRTSSRSPEGHTGGALNMVPAYTGYMAVNAITGHTRSWIMGQGHCVAAIDSVNLLLDNMTDAHAERYSLSDEGLTRYVRDFYSYRLRQRRQPGLAAGQPRQRLHGGRPGRGRLPGLHRAPVRPHAPARRAAGGLPQRRRLRGAAGERLGAPLVAGRRLRPGDADHDQQRPPHRPANDDVAGGRDVLVRANT